MRVTELSPSFFLFLRVRLLWVLGEGKLLFVGKLLSAMKFVHERGVLCAELLSVGKFVHERGVLCAELLSVAKFVHEMGILCAELPQCKKFVHETLISCTNLVFSLGLQHRQRRHHSQRSQHPQQSSVICVTLCCFPLSEACLL